jgi:transposase, IS5 family
MGQISFAEADYVGKRKKMRREVFLEKMEVVVHRGAMLVLIKLHYPTAGRVRRPYLLEWTLRVRLIQNCLVKMRFRRLVRRSVGTS